MNINRYITNEAVQAATGALHDHEQRHGFPWRETSSGIITHLALRAALPGILAAHRADVLREAADQYEDTSTDEWLSLAEKLYRPGGPNMPSIWLRLKAGGARCDEVHPQQDIHHPGGHPGPTSAIDRVRALVDEAENNNARVVGVAAILRALDGDAVSPEPSTVKGPVEPAGNFERYITELPRDYVAEVTIDGKRHFTDVDATALLRAALPGILAAHRADVLRSAKWGCAGCGWCCQGTRPADRGEGHRGCA